MPRQALLAATAVTWLIATAPASAYTLSGDYYEDQAGRACNTSSACDIVFPLPSATTGKLLNVHFVSCRGNVPPDVVVGTLAIADSAGLLNLRRIQSLTVAGTQIGTIFSWRQAVEMKVTGGPPRHVAVSLTGNATGTWSVSCAITGTLTDQ